MSNRLENQPKYMIGQSVTLLREVTYNGVKTKTSIRGVISEIKAAGTSEKDTYTYGITDDMPGCYHGGNKPFEYVLEERLDKHNLCDNCVNHIPECKSDPTFGRGKGNDNIIGCNIFAYKI